MYDYSYSVRDNDIKNRSFSDTLLVDCRKSTPRIGLLQKLVRPGVEVGM